MTESSDQQQQLEQLKLETSQESSITTDDKVWTDQGINENIVQKIRSYIENGKLNSSDIDSRLCEQLRSFPNDAISIDSLFNEFNNSDLTGVVNKGAFLCNLIKQWKIHHPQEQKSSASSHSGDDGNGSTYGKHKPGPDEIKLKQILERTGYKMDITAGQRKYGGPPPDGPEYSAQNSEVFIGKIPREVFEDELIPICEEAGKIWDLRLMIDPVSGFNKGYCFVTYCAPGESAKACERLNGYAIRPGKLLKANGSVANLRLFIGNIPKTKAREEIREELTKVVEGVTNVIVYTPADEADKKKNRGFCFVDFDTHKNASVAKRKLGNARVRIFNRDIAVDWADPDEEPDNDTMSQVKVLYVRNLTSDVSENDVKDVFLPYGNIERVRKVRDYAFVHFDKREDALNAMRALDGKLLGRNTVEISLAKPLSDKRKQAQVKREHRKPGDPPFNQRDSFDNNSQGGHHAGPMSGGMGKNPQRGPTHSPDDSFNANNFGAFSGQSPMRGGPGNRGNIGRGGGPSGGNRGGFSNNRGGGFHGGNRGGGGGGGGGNFNQNNRGGYNNNNNNNNNNFRGGGGGGYQGPSQYNNPGGFNNGPSNNPNDFGAFNGPPQNNNGRMGMNNSGFGMNSMQQNRPYGGGMKRPANQMNDGMMAKRGRPDTGSWGSMGGDGSNNMNKGGPQQQNARGNWYQDQGYNSQQQSNYSWN
ncbi:unnamed protein product [Rotaria socialis]|uniref:RRM domain-containing protein n=1 Tax=Rotaria socialis TaxID=392032 RepID=A0A821C7C6_9BILA|nr:unnamed protein product [Rotaria socialis]CAF3685953.1 unnamed protein product [Rotaria socialis]CAF4598230.1 unnamed protein product [Rotaria socialis]CAF4764060.1 unnamed protein product [Rotaria socialis]